MSVFSVVRAIHRQADQVLLRHLPEQARTQAGLWRAARWLFPSRVKARSPGEFVASARRGEKPARLPAWMEPEIAALVEFEPSLAALVGPGAAVEAYLIPWDMNYVGMRYAAVRHQLGDHYACIALSGAGAHAVDMVMLESAPRPLAVIDVVGDERLAALARAAGVDYAALPAGDLDSNDHCALVARLVLQIAPVEVLLTPDPVVVRCVERHGRAMASVSQVLPLVARAGADRSDVATASPDRNSTRDMP